MLNSETTWLTGGEFSLFRGHEHNSLSPNEGANFLNAEPNVCLPASAASVLSFENGCM